MSIFSLIFKKKKPKGTITFEVSGKPGSFNVTYTTAEKETKQDPDVPDGWNYSFTGKPGEYYFLAAQCNKRNASVNARILQDGKVINEVSKNGDYALAKISGSIP